MWLAYVLVALVGGPATPDLHQEAAAALYRVLTVYDAYGTFERADGEALVREAHVSGSLTLGSSFAVSPDGWLMTARHVVDTDGKRLELCEYLRRDWSVRVSAQSIRLVTMFEDIAGNTYGAIAVLTPKEDEAGDVCSPEADYTVTSDESSTARIESLDTLADLALIKLDVPRTRFLPLAPTAPSRWADVFAVGYSEIGRRTTASGAVAIRCEEMFGVCRNPKDDGTEVCPSVQVMRTTAPVLEGMSGAAQIVERAVVGVTTMKSVSFPIGFAVPSPYALRWYRSVRWPKKYPRPTVVCTPVPEL